MLWGRSLITLYVVDEVDRPLSAGQNRIAEQQKTAAHICRNRRSFYEGSASSSYDDSSSGLMREFG